MTPVQPYLLASLLGFAGGLRSFTAPAIAAWAARGGWLAVENTPFAFMGSLTAVTILTLGAIGELIADKLPSAPARTKVLGLSARFLLGALTGATVLTAAHQAWYIGAGAGALGGVIGAFAGLYARTRCVRELRWPDYRVALIEDACAIAGSLLLVSCLS